jgi:pimeloyl-ACP methyl ester carboxylesterase
MRRAVLGGLAAAALAAPSLAAAQGIPYVAPAFYCEDSADGGASGALTDREHRIVVGDPPLPARARQRRVRVNGFATTVTEAGRRKARSAVVFAHGNPNYSRDFDHLLTGASRYGRAIAFDFPGFGHADDRAGGPYDLDGAAAYFGAVMRKLGVKKVHLVVHDFGGPWALQWAAKHPDALASVVIINSGVLIDYAGHPLALMWVTPGAGEAQVAVTTRAGAKAIIQSQNPRPFPPGFLDRTYDFYDRGTRCAMLRYYRDMGRRTPNRVGREQAAVLRKRRRPALVVWGEKDPYIPLAVAYRQQQAFPGARVAVIKGAGHWPFVDYPGKVDAAVLPFLRRVLKQRKRFRARGRRVVRRRR